MPPPLLPWLRLLRLPALLSVPGDLLAGAAAAGLPPGDAAPRIPAVALAYLFGLVLNDVVDLPTDRVERPERPLPSGAIPLRAARTAAWVLGIGAATALPGIPLLLLLATILAYSLLKNRHPLLAPPLMAFCRAQALWIGAGAPVHPPPALLFWIAVWMFFIGGVTRLAADETRPRSRGPLPLLLLAGLAAGLLGGAFHFAAPGRLPALLPALLVLAGAARLRLRLLRAGRVTPPDIGAYLALLFPLQATVVALAGHLLPAALLLAALPLSRLLRRFLPAS